MRELRSANLSPVQLYLASLDEPRARETDGHGKTSVPTAARVLTKRCWQRGEAPLLTPLSGEFSQARSSRPIVIRKPNGGYCVGIAFEGPSFKWHV